MYILVHVRWVGGQKRSKSCPRGFWTPPREKMFGILETKKYTNNSFYDFFSFIFVIKIRVKLGKNWQCVKRSLPPTFMTNLEGSSKQWLLGFLRRFLELCRQKMLFSACFSHSWKEGKTKKGQRKAKDDWASSHVCKFAKEPFYPQCQWFLTIWLWH